MTIDVATGIVRILKQEGVGLGFDLPCLPGEQRHGQS
jgi:hypothetical protein